MKARSVARALCRNAGAAGAARLDAGEDHLRARRRHRLRALPKRATRRAHGSAFAADSDLVVVIGGGGGTGLPSAPLTLGARDEPDSASGSRSARSQSEWHETPPANLRHLGWVDNAADWIAAADRIVSTCGNTTVHQVAGAGKPWVVVPEWRYFAEQIRKAEALERAGLPPCRATGRAARMLARLWRRRSALDPGDQAALVDPDARRASGAGDRAI